MIDDWCPACSPLMVNYCETDAAMRLTFARYMYFILAWLPVFTIYFVCRACAFLSSLSDCRPRCACLLIDSPAYSPLKANRETEAAVQRALARAVCLACRSFCTTNALCATHNFVCPVCFTSPDCVIASLIVRHNHSSPDRFAMYVACFWKRCSGVLV